MSIQLSAKRLLTLGLVGLALISSSAIYAGNPEAVFNCQVNDGKKTVSGEIYLLSKALSVPLEGTAKVVLINFVWDGTYNIRLVAQEQGKEKEIVGIIAEDSTSLRVPAEGVKVDCQRK